MADTVQYRLERMLPELEDLEERGLFSKPEIAEIVKRRRKFEYRLKRPSPLKQDFLAYIDYETQLDALRRQRKRQAKDRTMSKSDFAGVSRVLDVYRIAAARFKGDLDLWFRYLEFCRSHRNGRMKEILAQVIRFHPKVPGVWIYAAAWEFDQNLNVESARALMQDGLRMCPASEDLWVEYLRMELTYLNKLKARKVALGEDKGSLARDLGKAREKHWRDENKELFMSLDEGIEGGKELSPDADNADAQAKATDLFKEQGLKFLQTVYHGAVAAAPCSFELRKRLFDVFEATDLAHSADTREDILADMRRDFAKDPQYWDWLARLELASTESKLNSRFNKAIEVYEEALQAVPSPTMFHLYLKFLMNCVDSGRGEDNFISSLGHGEQYVSRLVAVYKKAETLCCINEDMACEYVSFYLQLGKFDEARKIAGNLCSGKFSSSIKLWILRVSVETRFLTRDDPTNIKANAASFFELLGGVLSKASVSEAEDLWKVALKFFAPEKRYLDKLVEMAFMSVAKHGGGEDGFSLPAAIMSFVIQKDGIGRVREMYKRFLALPRPGLPLYRSCIELEESLASLGDNDCLVNARKLYESALASYDQNVDLWRDYHAMEIKWGTAETSNAVYWRARKTLRSFAAFVASKDML